MLIILNRVYIPSIPGTGIMVLLSIIVIIIYVFNAKIDIKMLNRKRTDGIVRNQKCFQKRKDEF